jgi:tungstate transport system substrate-binding protein
VRRVDAARAFLYATSLTCSRVLALACSLLAACDSQKQRVVLATTTSVEDSGLLDTLAASFNAAHSHYLLAPVAAGTGMVLEIGRRKDADVLVTHDSAGEVKFVADGHGYSRRYVMQNDFIIVGPPDDAGGLRGMNAVAAFQKMAAEKIPFVSRADDSGTHRRETRIWKDAGVQPEGDWYIQAGVGMGDALLLAGQKRAYIMTDRATYTKFKPRIRLDVMIDGDPPLLNKYHVINVRAAKNDAGGRAFAEWITGEEGRRIIAGFGKSQYGAPLFFVTQ